MVMDLAIDAFEKSDDAEEIAEEKSDDAERGRVRHGRDANELWDNNDADQEWDDCQRRICRRPRQISSKTKLAKVRATSHDAKQTTLCRALVHRARPLQISTVHDALQKILRLVHEVRSTTVLLKQLESATRTKAEFHLL